MQRERAEAQSRGMCSVKGCMDGGERISTKDEVEGQELGLSLEIIVITTEPAQLEELGARDGELIVGRVGGGKV